MNLIRTLKYASLIYLLIPSILFLLTWVNLAVGLSASILIIAYFFWYAKKDAANSVREVSSQYRGWVHIFGMLALAIGVNVLLGIGEFKRQESDFIANNFKYHDLIQHDWPLYYTHYKVHMCYYLGYYLPVAQLAKWFSLESARYFALGWSVIGLFFVLLWISTFVKKNGGLLVILVIIFPNAWIIYAMIDLIGWHREVFPHYFILINDFYLVLSKFEDNWAWAPQHTLPAVLGACFVLEAFVSKKVNRLELLLMLLSTMYWSPLASIGLFPFVVILFLKDFPTLFQQAKLPELLGMTGLVMAFLPLMIYFISTEGVNSGNTGFIWQTGTSLWIVYYAIYVLANVGIWYCLIRTEPFKWSPLIYRSMCIIMVLGIYRVGLYNDLNIRGVIPAFTIMSCCLGIWTMDNWKKKKWNVYFLAIYIFLGGLHSIRNFVLAIFPSEPLTTIEKPFVKNYTSMLSFQESAYGDSTAIKEYCLKKDGFFDKYLLKK
ncbi:hypothetical protein GOQ04_08925 [Emticicia sp. ODNR4P]|nr:hypothetical protein [Emticicia sp. ODNR4P]